LTHLAHGRSASSRRVVRRPFALGARLGLRGSAGLALVAYAAILQAAPA